MKTLEISSMEQLNGGSRLTAIIGGVACGGVAALAGVITFGIAAALLGPTCVGMIIITVVD